MNNPRLPADMMSLSMTGTNPLDPNSVMPFDRMYAKYRLTPSIVLGKSLFTEQIALTANVSRVIITATASKFYAVISNVVDVRVFIGNKGVTIQSGFGLPTDAPFVFAVTENAEVYAVAGSNTSVHIMDMGI